MALPPQRGIDINAILGQFDAGRKQAQERSQLEALTQAGQTLQQGGDMRSAAQGLLQSGNVGGFSALAGLANQDRANALAREKFEFSKTAGQKPTSAIQEFNLAKQQGFQGTFVDYKKALQRAGSTSVNINNPRSVPGFSKLPPGFVYKRAPDGQIQIDEQGLPMAVPIPGSPAAQKRAAGREAKAKGVATAKTFANVVQQDINRAIKLIEKGGLRFPTTGFGAERVATIGGTDANQLKQFLDTVKANAGFDKLQAMRDASPTGGALGQVSERELNFLQSAIGSLAQSQTEKDLVFNLQRVKQIYQNIIHGPQGDKAAQPQAQQPIQGQTQSGIRFQVK